MWTCLNCNRTFEKLNQPHSCKSVDFETHFKNKELARRLFDHIYKEINSQIGECKIISLPCCIHLYGKYDFIALLPKTDSLEIRFGLDRAIDDKRTIQHLQTSKNLFKNCFAIKSKEDFDEEMLGWIKQAYNLKD